MFEYSGQKEEGTGVAIISNSPDTPIHATNQEGTNDLLDDGYEFDDDRLPYPGNKPTPRGDTDRPVYKQGLKLIGYRRFLGTIVLNDLTGLS